MSNSAIQPILILLGGSARVNPTQFIIERAFAHHELDWRYLTTEVAPERLGDAVAGIRALGFLGGHCDHPHKQAIAPLLERLSDCAAAVGAVSAIFRENEALLGDNIEGKGLLALIRAAIDPAGKRFVLFGAGGLARAAGYELAAAGAAEIRVVNRTLAHADELAAVLRERFPTAVATVEWREPFEVPPDADALIYAVASDAADDEARIRKESLRPGLLVADCHFDPPCAWLLEDAAEHGCPTIDGVAVFVEQAAIAVEHWTGVAPDRQVLRDALEEFLGL